MLLYPLTNFETQSYYQNEPKSNGVYSRNNLPNIKDGLYVINIYEYEWIGNHSITLYVNGNNIYFYSFGLEHIPKENKTFIGNKNIITNIYRLQTCNSIMCGHFCIGFIDFMLKGKSLLEYKNLYFPNEERKNDKIVL